MKQFNLRSSNATIRRQENTLIRPTNAEKMAYFTWYNSSRVFSSQGRSNSKEPSVVQSKIRNFYYANKLHSDHSYKPRIGS